MTTVKTFEGNNKGRGKKIAIVAAKFNDFITERLLSSCLKQLNKLGVLKKDISVAWVPGAYEIPVTARAFARKKSVDAVICLGCVIRGETYHFELVADGCAQGIMNVSTSTGKPIILGVLSTETVEQAYKRSDEKGDDKGRDAADAAIEMVSVLSKIKR